MALTVASRHHVSKTLVRLHEAILLFATSSKPFHGGEKSRSRQEFCGKALRVILYKKVVKNFSQLLSFLWI